MSMLVPPQMLNTMAPASHDGGTPSSAAVHRRVLRRPGPPLHAAGALGPPYGLDIAPVLLTRLPARARHVGGRGSDAPLPDQGARRAAADVPAVLRPLHAHGPRGQLHPAGRQAQVRPQAGGPLRPHDRLPAQYPGVRDVVVSGGDVANMPWKQLESFVARLLEIENIRDIRLATKALMALPQHWLQDEVRSGMERLSTAARAQGHLARDPHPRQRSPAGDARSSPRPRQRCSTPAYATYATRASSCAASTPRPSSCSTCASRCSTAPGSCRTTSTSAT